MNTKEIKQSIKKATDGDPDAQNKLGCYYLDHPNVDQDHMQAMHWFLLSAEQGQMNSQYNLGVAYQTGYGVKQDHEQAVHWFKLSAEQGYAPAQYNLGGCYRIGQGVEQDYVQAVQLLSLAAEQGQSDALFSLLNIAAEQGHSDAQFSLGNAYKFGEGCEQNDEMAVHWWQLAAEQGHADAQFQLGTSYNAGEGTEESPELAVQWWGLAAKQGHGAALHQLAGAYSLGRGVQQDFVQMVHWTRIAAEQGRAQDQNNLGICYSIGQGVEQDLERAIHWFQQSAEQWDARGQLNLGRAYMLGQGVDKDQEKGVAFLRLSADQGDAGGQLNLGVAYMLGQGIDKDQEKGVTLLKFAAEQGNPEAQFNLGVAYELGSGVEQDKKSAGYYYRLAEAQGIEDAKYEIAKLDSADDKRPVSAEIIEFPKDRIVDFKTSPYFTMSICLKEQEDRIRELEKPILLVEGESDRIILSKAWSVIVGGSMPIKIIALDGTGILKELSKVNRPDVIAGMFSDRFVFCLLDNDMEGRNAVPRKKKLEKNPGVWCSDKDTFWCLLKRTEEHEMWANILGFTGEAPCTIESCFSSELRRSAMQDECYGVDDGFYHELEDKDKRRGDFDALRKFDRNLSKWEEIESSNPTYAVDGSHKKIFENDLLDKAIQEENVSPDKIDAFSFWFKAPNHNFKLPFAEWISGHNGLCPDDFGALNEIVLGIKAKIDSGEEPI